MQAAPIGNFIAHKIVLQCWQPSHYISSVPEHFIQIANKGTTKAISLLGSNEIIEFAAITLTYHSAYIAGYSTQAILRLQKRLFRSKGHIGHKGHLHYRLLSHKIHPSHKISCRWITAHYSTYPSDL